MKFPKTGATGTTTLVLSAVAIIVVAGVGLIITTQPKSSTSVQSSVFSTQSVPPNPSTTTTTASSSTGTGQTSSCSGHPPGGNCIAPYSYTFTISVEYVGPWKLSYQGYLDSNKDRPANASGTVTGTGSYSKTVTLSGLDNNALYLCAEAKKLDASNSTLTLRIFDYNGTSSPYGATSLCNGVVP